MNFNIIYVDCPWQYANWTDKKNGSYKPHYNGMTVEELCSLPIKDIAADNCALLFWITHPKLAEGCHIPIFKAWGFRPVSTAFNWVKTNKDGSPHMGIGFYTRGDSELCMLGLKGRMSPHSKSIRQTVISPIIRPHSSKPAYVRDKIVELFGDLPRIELFSRIKNKQDNGWIHCGYEVDGSDIRDSLKQVIEDTYV